MYSSNFLQELKDLENFRDIEIRSIHLDSREVKEGGLFFAIKGHDKDGSDFISSALSNGASLIISDTYQKYTERVIYFEELKKYIGIFASRFYNSPSSKIKSICVTGTNGKTTSVETFANMSNLLGYKSGFMSTINFSKDGLMLEKSDLTTPDAIKIHKNIKDSLESDAIYIAMEASSHGLEQDRLIGLDIDYAILTSFSHDHLDYHGDIQSYQSAKEKLFLDLNPKKNVVCIDSPFGKKLHTKLLKNNKETYSISIKENADFHASFEKSPIGLKVNLKAFEKNHTFELKTFSRYLASNIICSMAVLILEGVKLSEISKIAKDIELPQGRLERIIKNQQVIYIDYAHTPEALECTLKELNNMHQEPIWCLFGCGGNRDKDKRPLMGKIAQKYSNHIVLTNDNPRDEDEMDIINDILSEIEEMEQISINLDRKDAIESSILEMERNHINGVLLIAGKGHENYQEVNGNLYELNDKNIINSL